MSSDLVRIGGLWKNENNGKFSLGGNLGQARIVIFPNGFKKAQNDPDFILYIAPGKPKGGQGQGQEQREPGADEDPFPTPK